MHTEIRTSIPVLAGFAASAALLALAAAPAHGGATVSHGRVPDGLGANALAAYLRHDATETEGAHGRVIRFAAAPTVRSVQILNANLPRDFQLSVDPVPVSTADSRAGVDAATLPPARS